MFNWFKVNFTGRSDCSTSLIISSFSLALNRIPLGFKLSHLGFFWTAHTLKKSPPEASLNHRSLDAAMLLHLLWLLVWCLHLNVSFLLQENLCSIYNTGWDWCPHDGIEWLYSLLLLILQGRSGSFPRTWICSVCFAWFPGLLPPGLFSFLAHFELKLG